MSARRPHGRVSTASRASTTPQPASRRQTSMVPEPSTAESLNLPEYQPPVAPLTHAQQVELSSILKNLPIDQLQKKLKLVMTAVENTAGNINDKLREREDDIEENNKRRKKERSATQAGEEDEENEEVTREQEETQAMTDRVDKLTGRLDTSFRRLVDGVAYTTTLERVFRDITNSASAAADAATQASQARALHSQTQTQRTHPAASQLLEVTQPGEEPSSDEDEPEDAPLEIEELEPPQLTTVFQQSLKAATDAYAAKTPREKYMNHNEYTLFKRIVHDGRFGEENVPMPHKSTWFGAEEGGNPRPGETGSTRMPEAYVSDAEDDEEDFAVTAATMSTKCPLTLLEFQDPVTSRLCPHSFERSAIMGMIDAVRPPTRARGAPRDPNFVPRIQCPVTGCQSQLGREEVVEDTVVKRRIRRVQRVRQRRADEEEILGQARGGRVVEDLIEDEEGSGDDVDDVDEDRARGSAIAKVKMERRSGRLQTEDIEDDEDEDMTDG